VDLLGGSRGSSSDLGSASGMLSTGWTSDAQQDDQWVERKIDQVEASRRNWFKYAEGTYDLYSSLPSTDTTISRQINFSISN